MYQTYSRYVRAALLLFAATAAVPLHAQHPASEAAAPDATLYTSYSLFSGGGQTTVDWLVCGSTTQSEGCYASGSLGPFVAVGAMLEGIPVTKGNVVTRAIYVVDSGSANSVQLYVYKKTDTVTALDDTVVVTLARTIPLSSLIGGSTALVSMAANKTFLYVGTDQSSGAVEIRKSSFSLTQVGDFSTGVTSITSDEYGYIAITQGEGFTVLDPNGVGVEGGGGAQFLLGATQAVSLVPLVGSDAQHPHRLVVQPNTGPHPKFK